MSGDLGNLLTGELGEAEARFSHEDFAALYGRRIAGRVRRRRAVRAAGVGGGTMLTAGALVVGATQVPWGTLGATPGVGPSDCVTPSVTDDWQSHSTSINTSGGAVSELVFTDATSGSTILRGVQQPDGTYVFTDGQGNPLSSAPGVGGYYTVELPPGAFYDDLTRSISLQPGGAGAVSSVVTTLTPALSDDSFVYEVTVVPGDVPDATVRLTDPATGTTILSATRQVDGSYYFADMYGIQAVATLEVSGRYLVTVPQGPPVSSGGDADPGEGEILVNSVQTATFAYSVDVTPSATDDCYTPDPTPSGDGTASPDPSPSPDPSLAAKPDDVIGDSPFECGFEFPTESYGTEDLWIDGLTTVDGSAAEAAIRAGFQDPAGVSLVSPAGPVPVVSLHYASADRAAATAGGLAGTRTNLDPTVDIFWRAMAGDTGFEMGAAEGWNFVAAIDGTVVAVGEHAEGATWPMYAEGLQHYDRVLMYLLDPNVALQPCHSSPVDLSRASIVAVAGLAAVHGDGTVDETIYAWLPVQNP